jgi:hypothetical protein
VVVRQETWQRGQQILEDRLIVGDKGCTGVMTLGCPSGNREWQHTFGRNGQHLRWLRLARYRWTIIVPPRPSQLCDLAEQVTNNQGNQCGGKWLLLHEAL